MAYKSLRDFLEDLEACGDLIRVTEPVSTNLEMTEIQTRVLAERGPAILFENVINEKGKKNPMPVLVNLFGSVDRIASALKTTPLGLRNIGEQLAFLKNPQPPESLKDVGNLIPLAKKILAMRPKSISKGSVHEVVLKGKDINLDALPIQTCWPGEPAPLITWPLVVTKGSKKRSQDFNLGIYRMQKISKTQTLMRWLKHRGGAQHHRDWGALKKNPMPVAAVLGADPATILAAVTPVPETMSEYHFAGLLRNKRVELVDCKTIPIQVPAEAEIVLEGHVSLEDYRDEGPYGDHTGYYNSVEQFPVFTVSAITMRKDPIYLSTFTGRPPDEPSILGEALNEIFIPLLKVQFPEIVDFWLPPEGCSYRVAVVSIKKQYPGHAKRVMMAVWSYLRQFMYTKFVIVVDDDINVRKWGDVIWAVSTRMDPVRDVTLIENTPIDYLDFASPHSGLGGKMGLDATNKIGPETNREWGKKIAMPQEIIDLVSGKWEKLGLPGAGKSIWDK